MRILDGVGVVGVILTIGAYLMLQRRQVGFDSTSYLAANAVGSSLILVTLYFDWNLSAAVVEAFWVAISVYGLVRAQLDRRRGDRTTSDGSTR